MYLKRLPCVGFIRLGGRQRCVESEKGTKKFEKHCSIISQKNCRTLELQPLRPPVAIPRRGPRDWWLWNSCALLCSKFSLLVLRSLSQPWLAFSLRPHERQGCNKYLWPKWASLVFHITVVCHICSSLKIPQKHKIYSFLKPTTTMLDC